MSSNDGLRYVIADILDRAPIPNRLGAQTLRFVEDLASGIVGPFYRPGKPDSYRAACDRARWLEMQLAEMQRMSRESDGSWWVGCAGCGVLITSTARCDRCKVFAP